LFLFFLYVTPLPIAAEKKG